MCSISPDQQHKFHHSHHFYKNSIDIPPRKLLDRRSNDLYLDSPKSDDAVFSKFLPYNDDDDGSDPYSSDYFRIYEFKVRKCTRSRSHDWTDCPFAHPGEKARRRDPRRFHYSGTVCSEFRKGNCSKGDNCEFSHGVFECWLHPSRYRTEACKDGKNCNRKICFFAHSARQLRIVPETSSPPLNSPTAEAEKAFHPKLNHYCACCQSVLASPTSTLVRSIDHSSPPLSPPISTVNSPAFYGGRENLGMSYRDALAELMNSMEAMNVSEAVSTAPMSSYSGFGSSGKFNLLWTDVNFGIEEPPQFVMSPSTLSTESSKFSTGSSNNNNNNNNRFVRGEQYQYSGRNLMEESRYDSESNMGGPDLGWVNDLLT